MTRNIKVNFFIRIIDFTKIYDGDNEIVSNTLIQKQILMFIFDINFNTLSCMFDSMMINIRELCQYINNHDVKLKKSLTIPTELSVILAIQGGC